ncbi:hypothetical protein [Streptomyces sirii]|uniref:hypothetical protein n=1 Tax=Streptomyces sirii TaxID=3127701 RepID=UPI003D36ABCA
MIENSGPGSLHSLPLDELIAAWGGVGPRSKRADADPLVVDCARRLAADPGGEWAPLWTFGLVTMASYVAWRPGEGVAGRVVEALLAADSALGGRGCAHEAHPFRAAMERIDDEVGVLVPELRDFPAFGRGETADAEHDDASWCPTNVATCARITADVLTPFNATGTAGTISPTTPWTNCARGMRSCSPRGRRTTSTRSSWARTDVSPSTGWPACWTTKTPPSTWTTSRCGRPAGT